MDEKDTSPSDKKPGEGQEWPKPGKEGGLGKGGGVGKKGGDLGEAEEDKGDSPKSGDVGKPHE